MIKTCGSCRAFEYWRPKQVNVDVVILNERSSSYVQTWSALSH
jgi:hypothetical protein